ncbi:MAG: hypothetical protein HW386_1068, partial [Gammaproteobacteria bacterium]|nr:hypothetical protein [Gammaproteobacteria bacterium]
MAKANGTNKLKHDQSSLHDAL